jgi:hypothetical protein
MPYVHRNPIGEIDSIHRDATQGAQEFLPSHHAELLSFIGRDEAPQAFDALDADFVRVIEDVIDTLIVRNILNITDLPAEAQAKLFARKSFRERMSSNSLNLFGAQQSSSGSFEEVVMDTGFSDL